MEKFNPLTIQQVIIQRNLAVERNNTVLELSFLPKEGCTRFVLLTFQKLKKDTFSLYKNTNNNFKTYSK